MSFLNDLERETRVNSASLYLFLRRTSVVKTKENSWTQNSYWFGFLLSTNSMSKITRTKNKRKIRIQSRLKSRKRTILFHVHKRGETWEIESEVNHSFVARHRNQRVNQWSMQCHREWKEYSESMHVYSIDVLPSQNHHGTFAALSLQRRKRIDLKRRGPSRSAWWSSATNLVERRE